MNVDGDPALQTESTTPRTGGVGAPGPGEAGLDGASDPGRPEPPTLLVANYTDPQTPPDVYPIVAEDPTTALEEAAELAGRLSRSSGGRLPAVVIRELVSNIAHAGTGGAVVSILDAGNTLRVSDRGPGIPDKERALLPGFTTADEGLRTVLRGVGSGLGIARENLVSLGGSLDLDDNLGGGAVVTARVPPPPADAEASTVSRTPELSDRQLRGLLIILELGPVGPTSVAQELEVSASTAYRDLVLLEQSGLVKADDRGLRSATDEGLEYLQTVL